MLAVDEGNIEVMKLLFAHNPDPTLHSVSGGRNVYHYGQMKGGEVMEQLEVYLKSTQFYQQQLKLI